MRLRIQRLRVDVGMPTRAHPGDAGLDLAAADGVTIGPGQRKAVGTGLVVAIPDGYVGLVHPRSGLALRHGVTVVNAPGTIDAGYRGELKVALINLSDRSFVVGAGQRVAQLLVQQVITCVVEEVASLQADPTARGSGGFGSSG